MTDVVELVHADAQWEASDANGTIIEAGSGDVLEAAGRAEGWHLHLDRVLEGGRATYWTHRP